MVVLRPPKAKRKSRQGRGNVVQRMSKVCESRATPETRLRILDEYDHALAKAQELEHHKDQGRPTLANIEQASRLAMQTRSEGLLVVVRYCCQILGDDVMFDNIERAGGA